MVITSWKIYLWCVINIYLSQNQQPFPPNMTKNSKNFSDGTDEQDTKIIIEKVKEIKNKEKELIKAKGEKNTL